ncbi:MAG TPA: hypothetical protein VD837_06155 [Terriglobales bacterium]|nr:hypothetical protein [Terriglobales bacterium]
MRHSKRASGLLILFSVFVLFAVAGPPLKSSLSAQILQSEPEPPSREMRELLRQQEKARNKQRHQELQRDSDKLFQLATELKAAVDKSDENTLSAAVIKKAEEIEKLSKNVQKKMRGY